MTAKDYDFQGFVIGGDSSVPSTGRIQLTSYVNYMSIPNSESTNARMYTMSRRVYNGRVLPGDMSDLAFMGEGNYPLYGTYTMYFMNKGGEFKNGVYMVMRGSTGEVGNTDSVTWATVSETASPGTTLDPIISNSTWIPRMFFFNNSSMPAYFIVTVDAFNDDTVFNEPV